MRIFLFLLALLHAFPIFAATVEQPAYRLVTGQAEFPWSEGLSVTLLTDEKICQEKYGQKWRQKCASAPGQPGQSVKGISMQPQASGYWQWSDSNSLRFIPADGASLKPDVGYQIDLSGLYLPPSIKLDKKKLKIFTKPLSVRLQSLEFFINPSPDGEHRLACAVEFNYPVTFNPDIRISSPNRKIFGQPELVWNGERDRLNISWPLRELPANPSQCSILFSGMGQAFLDNGQIRYSPFSKEAGGTEFTKNLPSTNELFFIKSASLESRPDAKLDSNYILRLDTSLYARPDDLLENLLIYELPKYRSEESREACNWSLAPALSADIIQKSRPLQAILEKKGKLPQSTIELRIAAKQGSYILCAIDDKFHSSSGKKMARPWLNILHAEPITPEVGFLQAGNILSTQNGGKLDLFGRELDSIVWEAQLLRDPFLALLASSSWDPFTSPFASLGADISSFSASCKGEIPLAKEAQGKGQFASLDLARIMPDLIKSAANGHKGGLILISLTGRKDGKNAAGAQRLVLLSDLALIVKRHANGELQTFVRDLASRSPAPNLDVRILGANGLPVAQGKTDKDGQLLLPSLNGLEKEAAPVALIAGNEDQFTWLSLKDGRRELNYSDFNISGSHLGPDDMNIFIFSQRDIYRPGETMFFGCLARKGNLDILPEDLPLYAEILDPRGSLIWGKSFNVKKPGLADLSWSVPEEALSGPYIFNIRAGKDGQVLQSKTCRVEEFQPETLKLKITPPIYEGWLQIKDKESLPKLAFSLQNLYGTPAANHKVKATLELMPAQFRFKGFEDYIFNDAKPVLNQHLKRQLPEMLTDANGDCNLKLPQDLLSLSSALTVISAEAFNASGARAVTGQSSVLSSPMSHILGYRPQGDLTNFEYIPLNAAASVRLLALNPVLEKISLDGLEFSLAESRLASSLLSDGKGGFRYDENPLEELIHQWQGSCPDTGLDLKLDTSRPGDFILRIKDKDGSLLSSIAYTVIGEALAMPNSSFQPAKMRMKLNRTELEPGEELKLALSLPYDGFGLISLEREGVDAWQWFEARAGESEYTFKIPEHFEGKGYLAVNFVRNTDCNRIYMSPLSYAVKGLMVKASRRDMGLKVAAPERIRPGERLPIKISSKQKGKAILFAVDEGILQLTSYQKPDPLMALLGDRALDVKTLQALDLLMPVQDLKERLSAFGGGMDGGAFGARFKNPFKRKDEPPVLAWFSDLEVGPEEKEISLPIPDYYNGQIRIMAVGLSEKGTGSDMTRSIIQAPFIISPQLPLYVSPGDAFKGQVLLSNNGAAGEWEISLPESGIFNIIKTDAPRIRLESGEEKLWSFHAQTPDEIGNQSLLFMARKGEEEIKRAYNVSVRPSSFLVTNIQAGYFSDNASLPASPQVYSFQAESMASISTLPLALAQALGLYLSDYPYGCTEQLLSRSFASLLLKPWVGKNNKNDGKLLESCLGALNSRMTGNGLSLWPAGEGDLFLSAYAADFLLNLRQAGILNADNLLDLICDSLAENCSLNDSSLESARASAYAIWILTREGRITTQLLEELLRALNEREVEGWRNDLTALLIAASQKEMHIQNTVPIEAIYYEPAAYFDELAQYALHMFILSRYFPEKLNDNDKNEFFRHCAAVLNRNEFATFSAAQSVRAICALGQAERSGLFTAAIHCPGKEEESFEWANGNARSLKTDFCPQYAVKGDPAGLYWQISVSGYKRDKNEEAINNGIVIEKEYLDRDGNIINRTSPGEEIQIRIRVRSESGPLRDCVIADLLPGGLEMLFDMKEQPNLPEAIKYIDKKGDRMLIFADLDNNPLEFAWRTRAVAEGDFQIAPAYAEAMYQRAISGQSKSGILSIANE